MTDTLEIFPGVGVGPLVLGMTRDQVRAAMGEPESRDPELSITKSASSRLCSMDIWASMRRSASPGSAPSRRICRSIWISPRRIHQDDRLQTQRVRLAGGLIAASFEEQGDVDDHQGFAAGNRSVHPPLHLDAHRGVHEAAEVGPGVRVAKHDGTQGCAVQGARGVDDRLPEAFCDLLQEGLPRSLELVDDGVRIHQHGSQLLKHRGHRALARADPPSQADDPAGGLIRDSASPLRIRRMAVHSPKITQKAAIS